MRETKITKDRIRHHFTYSWWKYLMLVVAAVFGWNMIYTTTAYRPPKSKRLDVYFVTHTVPDSTTSWFQQQILSMYPEVEDSSCVSVTFTESDNYYGSIQLTTYIGAGEGDIYVLTRERFEGLMENGAFLNLESAIAEGKIDLRGIDVAPGIGTDETGITGVYGIPAESLYGFMRDEIQIDNRDLMICVTAYSHNQDTALDFVNWLVETMRADKPDWLIEYEEKQRIEGTGQAASDIPSY